MLQLGEYVKFSYCALRGLNIDLFHRRPHIKPWGLPKFLPLNFGKRSPFPYPGEGTLLIGALLYPLAAQNTRFGITLKGTSPRMSLLIYVWFVAIPIFSPYFTMVS